MANFIFESHIPTAEEILVINDVVTSYRVRIQLDALECHKEWDASGHSEPYLWPAFLLADARSLGSVLVEGRFEEESAREILGEAGRDVKPGDIIPIPESLGLFEKEAYVFSRKDKQPVLAVGFVLQLMENDGAPEDAMAAGHRVLAPELQEELNKVILTNDGPPTAEDIENIKVLVSKKVKATIRKKYSEFEGIFWPRDDELGTLGAMGTKVELTQTDPEHDPVEVTKQIGLNGQTIMDLQDIQRLAGRGPVNIRSRIRGTRKVWINDPNNLFDDTSKLVEVEHHYTLVWTVEVQVLGTELGDLPSQAVVERVVASYRELLQIDNKIGRIARKLREARGAVRKPLIDQWDQQFKRNRPRLHEAFAQAWKTFVQEQRDLTQKCNTREKYPPKWGEG